MKSEIMKFRVTPDERVKLEEKALLSNMSMSDYLRSCAFNKNITVISGVDNLTDELRRIGNNLNQLTHAVNSGYIIQINLIETRKELSHIWQSLNSLPRVVR